MSTFATLAFLIVFTSLGARSLLFRGEPAGRATSGEVALLIVIAVLGLGATLSGCVHVRPEDPSSAVCERVRVTAACADILQCRSPAGVWWRSRAGLDWLTCGYADGACQERSRDQARASSCGVSVGR